jgi:hypothetical protein
MAATPSPPEHPSEREQDVIREIERATGWPEPLDETDREKQVGEETSGPPSGARR